MAVRHLIKPKKKLYFTSKNEIMKGFFQIFWQDNEGKPYTRIMTEQDIILFNRRNHNGNTVGK